MEVITTTGLSRHFDKNKAVDNLTFSVSEGEIFGLVGPDGSGKTTLMRLLTTVMDPTKGQASVLDLDTVKQAETIKEKIGYLSQKCGLYPDLTVIENLQFFADIYCLPYSEREHRISDLLEFSQLTPFKERPAGNLSGGMKQKLGLACALIHHPRLLFLDEPTYGVDPLSRRELWRILYQLTREKVTIVIATSDMDEAERCSRLGLMHKGKMIACGTPKEMRHLYRESIVEIRNPEAASIFKRLQDKFPAGSIKQFGGKVHIRTPNPEQTQTYLASLFKSGEWGQSEIERVEPSLEDIFVALISSNDTEGANE